MRKKRKWLWGLGIIGCLVIGVVMFLAVIRNSSFYLDASKVKKLWGFLRKDRRMGRIKRVDRRDNRCI